MTRACQFCKIAAEKPNWALAHADGRVVSFKPFGAATKLHRMFVPTIHVVDAAESPEITGMVFAEAASWAASRNVPFNLVVNSGADAGQSVFHLHVHYVPREAGDGLGYRWSRDQ